MSATREPRTGTARQRGPVWQLTPARHAVTARYLTELLRKLEAEQSALAMETKRLTQERDRLTAEIEQLSARQREMGDGDDKCRLT